jgi:hypothetical protein
VLGTLCQASTIPILDACHDSASTIATLEATDQVTVRHSVAGEAQPCYAISVVRSGTEFRGYLLGNSLPAIQEYEHRLASESRMFAAPPPPKLPVDRTIADPGPLAGRQFPQWTGADSHGRPLAIPGNSKLTLVVFWRPQSRTARLHAAGMNFLSAKFGITAVGLTVGSSVAQTKGALEDMTLSLPWTPDRSSLASEFSVDASKGTTLVLDPTGKILASSSDQAKLQAILTKLLSLE